MELGLFCIDFKALLKIIIKNQYIIPSIDDLMDQVQGVIFFSKFDLRSGYQQVWVQLEDTWILGKLPSKPEWVFTNVWSSHLSSQMPLPFSWGWYDDFHDCLHEFVIIYSDDSFCLQTLGVTNISYMLVFQNIFLDRHPFLIWGSTLMKMYCSWYC